MDRGRCVRSEPQREPPGRSVTPGEQSRGSQWCCGPAPGLAFTQSVTMLRSIQDSVHCSSVFGAPGTRALGGPQGTPTQCLLGAGHSPQPPALCQTPAFRPQGRQCDLQLALTFGKFCPLLSPNPSPTGARWGPKVTQRSTFLLPVIL